MKQVPNTVEKHGSATGYIFSKPNTVWKIVLLKHKKFGKWIAPGGHIENHENALEAVLREIIEETGLQNVTLKSFIHQNTSLLTDRARQLLPPEYLFEQDIPEREDEPAHMHLDHIYVGITEYQSLQSEDGKGDTIGWFSEEELIALDMFTSVRSIAKELFRLMKQDASTSTL